MMKWNTEFYDHKHGFVTRLGSDLLEMLAAQAGERVLDIGCGTGHLTNQIAAAGATVVGLDSSAEMIDAARQQYPALTFVQADATHFSFESPFDAIFSNAALHWIRPPDDAVRCMSAALRPNGRFVVEFGGKGNVQSVYRALADAILHITGRQVEAENYFPSVGEYASLLEQHGIEVIRAELFERPTRLNEGEEGLMNWVRMFRPHALELVPASDQPLVAETMKRALRDTLYYDDAWHADYRRLRIIGIRTSD